jgi:hypothetical protein
VADLYRTLAEPCWLAVTGERRRMWPTIITRTIPATALPRADEMLYPIHWTLWIVPESRTMTSLSSASCHSGVTTHPYFCLAGLFAIIFGVKCYCVFMNNLGRLVQVAKRQGATNKSYGGLYRNIVEDIEFTLVLLPHLLAEVGAHLH